MKVIIRDNAKDAALWVAHRIAGAINAKAKVSKKPFVLGLPTGSTPEAVYAELARMNKAGEVSFKNVVTFNMDEYVGLRCPRRLQHGEVVAVGVGKNRRFDHLRASCQLCVFA